MPYDASAISGLDNTSPCTVSNTGVGSNLIAYAIGLFYINASAHTTPSCTYDGVAMTKIYDVESSEEYLQVAIFRLQGVATGAKNCVMSWAGGTVTNMILAVTTVSGALQTGTPEGTVYNVQTATNPSTCTVADAVARGTIIDAVIRIDVGKWTLTSGPSGATLRQNTTVDNYQTAWLWTEEVATTGSQAQTVTLSGTGRQFHVSFCTLPAPGGGLMLFMNE